MKNRENNLNILYVSSACSEEVYNNLKNKFIIPIQYSTQKFHNLIIKGIANNENVSVDALTGIPVNRKKIKKILFKEQVSLFGNIKYTHVGFINLPVLKQILTNINMAINILKWNNKNKKNSNKIIICDGAYVTVVPTVVFLSRILKIKTVTIVADIYEYMSDKLKERGRVGIAKNIITKLCNYCWDNYDGFILLTEQMNKIVNPNEKPYMIMEGIATNETEKTEKTVKENYIMYARWFT